MVVNGFWGKSSSGNYVIIKVIGPAETDSVSVTTPSGITINLTWKGEWSLSASGFGMYTVTASNGTKTVMQDVLVDETGEYSVRIEYVLWLYRDGDECEDVTGGWGLINKLSSSPGTLTKNISSMVAKGGSRSSGADAGAMTLNKVSLVGFTNIKIEVSGITNSTSFSFGLWASSERKHDSFAWSNSLTTWASGAGVKTLAINPAVSEAYIYISSPPSSSYETITKVWLE